MSAQVLQFFRRVPAAPVVRDWTQQELAEFYRVESALLQAGVLLETDRGLSDEGEPWFIFCRAGTGDVFIHFARIDGEYVVDGASFEHPARGPDFPALVRRLIDAYPLAKAKERGGTNVLMHPAALLIALVGAAFFHSNDAKAAEADGKPDGQRRTSLLVTNSLPQLVIPGGQSQYIDHSSQAAAVILSAILTLQEDLFSAALSQGPAAATNLLNEWIALASIGSVQSTEIQAPSLDADAPAVVAVPMANGPVASHLSVTVAGMEAGDRTVVSDAMVALPEAVVGQAADASPVELPAAPSLKMESARVVFANGAAPAPDIDAVDAVVAATGTGSTLYQLLMKALPQVEQLPSIILELIRHGAVVGNFETLPLPTNPGEPNTLPPTSGGVVVQPTPTLPPVQLPTDGVTPPVVIQPDPTQPTDSVTPPVIQPEPTPAKPPIMQDPKIEAAIADFISKVEHLKVMIEGKTLILFDEDVLNPLHNLNMSSVTFTFGDGSAVSLVGMAHELPSLSFFGQG